MRTSKIVSGLITLVTFLAVSGPIVISAQVKLKICRPVANQIYFVASGQSVTEVRPGSNGGNGYQLDIEGTNVDKFEVIQEKYMTSVGVIPGYTNSTAAKWQIFFAPNMGREISTIRMKSSCGRAGIFEYKLTTKVTLLDK